jgi:hypothetical protein
MSGVRCSAAASALRPKSGSSRTADPGLRRWLRACWLAQSQDERREAMATFWTIVTMAYTFGVLALIGYAMYRMFTPHGR